MRALRGVNVEKRAIKRSKNAILGVIFFIAGAIVIAAFYAVGFAVVGFGLATLAVFYYLGTFWGVAWLVLCAFLLAQLNKNDTKNG